MRCDYNCAGLGQLREYFLYGLHKTGAKIRETDQSDEFGAVSTESGVWSAESRLSVEYCTVKFITLKNALAPNSWLLTPDFVLHSPRKRNQIIVQ